MGRPRDLPLPGGEEGAFGILLGTDVKCLVRSVPEAFDEVAETMEEREALADRIVGGGGAP